MEEGQHIKNQIEAVFGVEESLYGLLGVSSEASTAEIKKAYRRLALKHHPDRGGNEEKFKALSAVHSILTDEDKRKVYDETGEIDGSGDAIMSDESFEFWDKYFRALFPKVTEADIVSFSESYKGSTGEGDGEYNERQDILDAYNQHDGSFERIMECVMLAEQEDESRITDILSEAINSGELDQTPAFENHLASCGNKKKKTKKRDVTTSSKTAGAKDSITKKKNKKNNEDDLASLILGNQSNRHSAMSSIFARYGADDKDRMDHEAISDADFERTRASLKSKKSRLSGGGKKTIKKSSKSKR